MKQKIYDTATALGWTAKLEIQIGEHITDVILEQKNQTPIAVECQCSQISFREYLEREQTYRKNGFNTLWIFGGPHFTRITNKIQHERGYDIQRISLIHKYILKKSLENYVESNLYTLGYDNFYQVTDFQHRFKASTLGWYHKKPVFLAEILERYTD